MAKQPLFRDSIDDKLRAALVTDHEYTPESAASIDSALLRPRLMAERLDDQSFRRFLEDVPEWVAAGHVHRDFDAARLSRADLMELGYSIQTLEMGATDRKRPPVKSKALSPAPLPDLSRGEVIAMLAQAVAVMAAQQEQIEELRDQVATLHNSTLAGFGHEALVAQFTDAARDFEGIDVMLKLEEQTSASDEFETVASDESAHSLEKARNVTAAVTGLASLVAGMNLGGTANLSDMNRAAKALSARAKRQMKVRSKGEVRIKIGKVTGGHK